jgi:hypothetical protein
MNQMAYIETNNKKKQIQMDKIPHLWNSFESKEPFQKYLYSIFNNTNDILESTTFT